MRQIDYIRNAAISGGEPFLHKRIADVIDMVCLDEKVATATIFTNATIIPADEICERLSMYDNIQIIISDYGDISKNKEPLMIKLREYNIPFVLSREMVWYDYARIKDVDSRDDAKVQEIYRTCNMNCMALAESIFSKCHVAVSLKLLGATPPKFEEVERSTIDLDQIIDRKELERHFKSKQVMGACYVCSGKSRTDFRQIPPAIQTKSPLPYKKYE